MAASAGEPSKMNLGALATLVAVVIAPAAAGLARADGGIRRETVKFASGASSAQIKGQIKGDATVDYVIRAAAGQTLSVALQKSNPQNYFNVLPPGSNDVAMFVGDAGGDYKGLLPADGDYVVRVYLMRAAARRGESSSYTVTIGATGKALAATPASKDARVAGTPYHASATIKCVPAFENVVRDCEAFVLRRGFDGSATVDFKGQTGKRSILFVKGKPVASNAMAIDALSSERKGDVTIVKLGEQERYEIPDALVSGG
jgi:hypothetical protein